MTHRFFSKSLCSTFLVGAILYRFPPLKKIFQDMLITIEALGHSDVNLNSHYMYAERT